MNWIRIHRVRPKQVLNVIDCRTPLGLFLTKEGRTWVAVDNSTGDAWTEDFTRKRQAIRWLCGEFEVRDQAKRRVRINDTGELVAAALAQGIALSGEDAGMILGYLEGHDYCLMVDDSGTTVRHDEQYGDSRRGGEPYTIQDTIVFCQEMNEDLLNENSSQNEPDVEYLAHLRRDSQALDALMLRLTLTQTSSAIKEG